MEIRKCGDTTMDHKSMDFIVNPISGTNDKTQIIKLIQTLLDKEKFDYQIHYTQYAGHAEQIAREASNRHADVVVAIGGDGTVNEVARALIQTKTALGIIPCGSGNGLARHLEIPMEPAGALKVLNECLIKDLDYGIINGHPFFCTCGIGFDAFVSSKFAEAGKRGFLTYLDHTLKEGLKYKPETYHLVVDDNKAMEYEAFLIACANASQYGNNAYIAPQASMSDGLLDVTIMEPISILEAPQIAIQLFNKRINENSKIKSFRCKKIHISRHSPGVIHYDGDPVETSNEIDVEVVSKGLKVVVNEGGGKYAMPLLQMFADFYVEIAQIKEDWTQIKDDIWQLRDEVRDKRKRLLEKNKRLLEKNKEMIRKIKSGDNKNKVD